MIFILTFKKDALEEIKEGFGASQVEKLNDAIESKEQSHPWKTYLWLGIKVRQNK